MSASTEADDDAAKASAPPGRVGPNAIIRMVEALEELEGAEACSRIFAAAGLSAYLSAPPADMVDEHEVAALYRATWLDLPPDRAASVARDAGRRTGDYLLANRIPRLAQRVLAFMPRRMALRILLGAIGRHAWTFAGSGAFSYEFSAQPLIRIERSPLCLNLRMSEPVCDYFAATFERIFREILAPRCSVREIECAAAGDAACVFSVALDGAA